MNIDAELHQISKEAGQIVLPQQYADEIQRFGVPIVLEKNQILCKAGDVPDSCYYVCSGQVVAYEYTPAGSEYVFSINRPGELILAPSMIVTQPLLLSFKATTQTVLIKISRDSMFQAMMDDQGFSITLISSLSTRLLTLIEQSYQRDNYSVPWRVCNLLLSMADCYGVNYDGKVLIQEKVSQQTIANNLHANRVTIARAIRDLKSLGLVEYINGYYCIRSIDKLKKHMDYLETIPNID
jgi:CRP/FNR family transcriptional regulator